MKTNFFRLPILVALPMIIFVLSSCTKEKAAVPAQQSSPAIDDNAQTGEIVSESVAAGVYTILRFIDTGDNETAQFNGYTFEFQADGDLIARRNGSVFNGRWSLNSAETRMTIRISGTAALDDLDDDDWRVNKLTNRRISINKSGPDRVIFVMQ